MACILLPAMRPDEEGMVDGEGRETCCIVACGLRPVREPAARARVAVAADAPRGAAERDRAA